MNHAWYIPLNNKRGLINGQFSLIGDSYLTVTIQKKSDTNPFKTLIRSFDTFCETRYSSGIVSFEWDKTDNDGNLVVGDDYEMSYVAHDIQKSYQKVGNTSIDASGEGVWHGYSRIYDVCEAGSDSMAVGRGFDERSQYAMARFLKTEINRKINIIHDAYATNLTTEWMCSNATHVFGAGFDPYPDGFNAGGDHDDGGSWFFGVTISDFTEAIFDFGEEIGAGNGRTYLSAGGIVRNAPTNLITGMCCNATYIWVARGSQNAIYCYSATTLELLSTTTTNVVNPKCLQYDSSNGGRIWWINDDNNTIAMFTIGALGALTTHSLTISDFPSDKLAIGIDNATNTLAVVVGGIYQQVWRWSISAATPTGTNTGKLGSLGGNTNATGGSGVISNTRFYFGDAVTNLNNPYVKFDSNSRVYIGDPGNSRNLIFSSSWTHVDTMMYLPALYSISVNMDDCTRVFANEKEFTVQSDGSWVYAVNRRKDTTADTYSDFSGSMFKWVWNGSNGKTYATRLDYSPIFYYTTQIGELTSDGWRYTSIDANRLSNDHFHGYFDSKNGVCKIRELITSTDLEDGATPAFKERIITYDGSDNPVLGSFTTICTTEVAVGDAIEANYNSDTGMTVSGVIMAKNNTITDICNYHAEFYNSNTGTIFARTAYKTLLPAGGHLGYLGPPVNGIAYDIANNVQYAGFDAQEIDGYFYYQDRGEFRYGRQSSKGWFYTKKGQAFLSVSRDLLKADATADESPSGAAGNVVSARVILEGTNKVVYQCDESVGGAIQRIVTSNWSSYISRTVNLVAPNVTDNGKTYILDGEVLGTVNSSWTVNHAQATGFSLQHGVGSYDRTRPDIHFKFNNTFGFSSVTATSPQFDYSVDLTEWTIEMDANWRYYTGSENSGGAQISFEVLDDAHKVLHNVTFESLNTGEKYLKGSGTTILHILDGDSDTIINTMWEWNRLKIVGDDSGATITYNGISVVSPIVDGTADWNKPSYVRIKGEENGGGGDRILNLRDLIYIDTGGTISAPLVSDAETIDENTIRIYLSKNSDGNITFTVTEDGSPVTVNGVSGADGTDTRDLDVSTLTAGTTLELTYTAGNVESTVGGIPMVNQVRAITNNLVASGLVLGYAPIGGSSGGTFSANTVFGNRYINVPSSGNTINITWYTGGMLGSGNTKAAIYEKSGSNWIKLAESASQSITTTPGSITKALAVPIVAGRDYLLVYCGDVAVTYNYDAVVSEDIVEITLVTPYVLPSSIPDASLTILADQQTTIVTS